MTAEKEPVIKEIEIKVKFTDGTEKSQKHTGDLDHIIQNLLIRDIL